MGIEAIGSIGRAVSVAPSIGRAAAIGSRIGGFPAPKFEAGIRNIANPFKAEGKVRHNSFPKRREYVGFSVPAVIAEAEAIVRTKQIPLVIARSEATKQSNYEIATLPSVARNDVLRKFREFGEVRVNLQPKVEAFPQVMVRPATESRPTNSLRMISKPAPFAAKLEQVVEEKKTLAEKEKEGNPQAKRSEKQSVAKVKIVEAVKVTHLRRLAVFEAVRKVKEEAEKTGEKVVITGKKLKKFLSVEFWKYTSPLVGREGHDGTIPLTLNAIENNQKEYTNLEEAQTGLSKPVAEHIPLQKGEGGRDVTVDEVREVLEGKEKENLRSQTPVEIVVKRVVVRENETVASAGQAVNTVVEEKEEIIGEPTLKSLGLEEVFQKAA